MEIKYRKLNHTSFYKLHRPVLFITAIRAEKPQLIDPVFTLFCPFVFILDAAVTLTLPD